MCIKLIIFFPNMAYSICDYFFSEYDIALSYKKKLQKDVIFFANSWAVDILSNDPCKSFPKAQLSKNRFV